MEHTPAADVPAVTAKAGSAVTVAVIGPGPPTVSVAALAQVNVWSAWFRHREVCWTCGAAM